MEGITILKDPMIRAELKKAWYDSQPGISGGHEEGGFVIRDVGGSLYVLRWSKGTRNSILVPPHNHCTING